MTISWRFDDWTDVERNDGITRKYLKIICVMLNYVRPLTVYIKCHYYLYCLCYLYYITEDDQNRIESALSLHTLSVDYK